MKFLTLTGETAEFRRRYRWMGAFAAMVFFGLVVRLFWLQVVRGEHYYAESEQNIVRTRSLAFTRGVIRDRAGRVVATNRPSNDAYVTPLLLCREVRRLFDRDHPDAPELEDASFCPIERSPTIPQLADFLDFESNESAALAKRIRDTPMRRREQQMLVKRDITRQELARLETHASDLTGVDVVTVPARTYPFTELAAHGVGYINEVDADDLDDCPPPDAKHPRRGHCGLEAVGYRVGDQVGRMGVERYLETLLRGKRGWEREVVDVHGRRQTGPEADALLVGPRREESVPGHDVDLTIDVELERTIDRAFRGQPAGAAVVVEVETGRVLALYSKPSFDPNLFSTGMTVAEAQALHENMFNPQLDRTLGGKYYPGSTFKIVTALAALEGGLVTPDELIHCQGWHELGRRAFRCSQPHGNVNMHDALVRSCNVYFYNLAQRVGIDRIALMARDLGFGSPTGVGLNFESAGFVPTKSWYERPRAGLPQGGHFVQGFTLNAAIGQGATQVTLLQLAMAYAAIANGGILYTPQIVQEVRRADGSVLPDESFQPRVRQRISASREHIALLQQGLWGVVNEEEGTAYEYRVDGVDASGKTGTAQVDRAHASRDLDPRRQWYLNRNHAWFAGYAPSDAPEIAVVVLVEHGGQGGKDASPIALRIMRDYLQSERPDAERPSLVDTLANRPSRRPNTAGGTAPVSTH